MTDNDATATIDVEVSGTHKKDRKRGYYRYVENSSVDIIDKNSSFYLMETVEENKSGDIRISVSFTLEYMCSYEILDDA